ncbi:MAG: nucleotidyltransferase [Tyzzerella sp.]|nr:nucleotidyltransferase [Tyzzerella sp.]
MKIVGLIAEYNPFHNGHQYHIEKAKEITGADHIIVVMSGDFVQRGTPAIMPKHLRTEMTLKAGAALVVEMPVCYATGSAEYFAYGAVSLLDKLGCVDAICFGSECGDIHKLEHLARIMVEEPKEYKTFLLSNLRNGSSYPLARQNALKEYLKSDTLDEIIGEPNNILGIEYIKALYKLKSKMIPYTITRISSNYHDTELQQVYSSASAIRKEISKNAWRHLGNQIPENSIGLFEKHYQKRYPVVTNDFSLLLKYKLLNETKTSLLEYADVSEELANRIMNQLNQYIDFEQFCNLLKTKEVTYTRISRALLHILLNIKKTDYEEISYAHILGFRKDSTSVLTQIKETSSIPLISKLTNVDCPMLGQDIYASNLYESVITDKFKTPFINEYEHSIVLI